MLYTHAIPIGILRPIWKYNVSLCVHVEQKRLNNE